jgi:hypothetical protein
VVCIAGGSILRWRDTKTGATIWQVPQKMIEIISKSSVRCVHQMAIYMVCNIYIYFF